MTKYIMTALVATAVATAGGDVAPIEVAPIEAPVAKNFYVGLNVYGTQAFVSGERDWADNDSTANVDAGLGVQAGWVAFRSGDFSTALEGRYGQTFNASEFDTTTWGIYAKPAYDFGPVTGYALLGYSDVSYDFIGTDIEVDTDGFAWGVGISGDVTDSVELFADYTVNPTVDTDALRFGGIENEVITLGVNYHW